MTATTGNSTDRKSDQFKFLLGIAALVIVGLSFFAFGRTSEDIAPDDPGVDVFEKHDAIVAELEEDLEKEKQRSRAEYASYVEVRLREHDARLTVAKKELAESVAEYFEKKKECIPDYAEEALTWGNRWTAFWDEDEYHEILQDLFSEHVMSSDDMREGMTAEVEKYLLAVAREELALSEDVRVKMNALPGLGLDVALDQESFNKLISEHIARTAKRVKRSSQQAAFAGGFCLAAAFAFATPSTVGGVTSVAGVSLGSIPPELCKKISKWLLKNIDDIIDELIITEDEVESSALRLLDELKYTLMKGAEEPWEEYNELAKSIDEATDDIKMRQAIMRMNEMRNSGMLGLQAVLDLIQDRNLEQKTQIFRALGLGEE